MLEEVLRHIKNWFRVAIYQGTFEIADGELIFYGLKEGQYYRLFGSIFNDGLHKFGEGGLTDEVFFGELWALAVPKAVIDLADEIKAWQDKNGEAVVSPYQSESFGGYSYAKASGSGGVSSWQGAFRSRLNAWRKI